MELRDDRGKQVERVQLQLCPEADGPADPGARAGLVSLLIQDLGQVLDAECPQRVARPGLGVHPAAQQRERSLRIEVVVGADPLSDQCRALLGSGPGRSGHDRADRGDGDDPLLRSCHGPPSNRMCTVTVSPGRGVTVVSLRV